MFPVVVSSERKQIKQNIIILHTVQNDTVKAKITSKTEVLMLKFLLMLHLLNTDLLITIFTKLH